MKLKLPIKINFNIKLLLLAIFLIIVTIWLLIDNLTQVKKNQLEHSLFKEASVIESVLSEKFDSTFLIIEMMGKEIAKKPHDKNYIKKILEKYKSDKSLNQIFSWTIFSWADDKSQLTVDEEYGILKSPIDLFMRDYIPKSISNPWKLFLGNPVYGSTSKQWMIPGGTSITDKNGKLLGTITIGFAIEDLTRFVQKELDDKNIEVKLIYKGQIPVFSVNKSSIKIFLENSALDYQKQPNAQIQSNLVQLKHNLKNQEYDLILTYDGEAVSSLLWEIIYSRLLEILIAIILSLTLLIIIYKSEKEKREKITSLMQKELSARQSSEIIIRVGHELRNFVSAIIGLSDLIQMELKNKKLSNDKSVDKELNHLDHINDISQELMNFITDLIDINKPEDGKFTINKSISAVDFEDMLDRSLMILKGKIKNKKIIINTYLDNDLHKIPNLDSRRIKQILVSLIGNSIKHSKESSIVNIYMKNLGEKSIEISIRDSGIGMTQKQIDKSLEKYHPNQNLKEYNNYSIELNLPIVKYLTELQGGTIVINSIYKKGTEVRISFNGY